MPSSKAKKHGVLICVGLFLAVFAVFSPALKCDFINLDDPAYITENPHVQQGITAESLKWAFTTGHASLWIPLTWISHMLDIQFYGLNPMGHHFTSILIHAVNSVLLFLLLRRMTGALWASAFIAAMFGLHPLRVESVAWACERKDVLSTFFWLLTVGAYVRYVQTPVRRAKWFAFALLFFAFALMSKPMVVTLPFVLLLIDLWPLKRINISKITVGNLKPLLLEKLPFIALALGSSIVTIMVGRDAVSSFNSLTFAQRIENALVAYVRYIGKMFWPTKLAAFYPYPDQWFWWQIIASIASLITITAIVIRQLRLRPYMAVGWFWFVGALLPVIGIVQAGAQSMADRFTYVPTLGLLILVTWTAIEFVRNRTVLTIGAISAICACCVVTPIQAGYWKNSETLFTHAIAVTDKNYVAYNSLGVYLSNIDQTDEAIASYKKSVEIDPTYDQAHNNLGVALSHTGDIGAAIHEYQIVLRHDPSNSDAYNNYGIALAMEGQLDAAIENFHAALRYNPDSASAHGDLANVYAAQANNLFAQGNADAAEAKFDAAISEYNNSLQLVPEDSQTHKNLGNVFAQRGKMDEAIREFRKSIEIRPENPEAHFALGFVLARQGKSTEAEAEYLLALKQKPNYPEATQQLSALHSGK